MKRDIKTLQRELVFTVFLPYLWGLGMETSVNTELIIILCNSSVCQDFFGPLNLSSAAPPLDAKVSYNCLELSEFL